MSGGQDFRIVWSNDLGTLGDNAIRWGERLVDLLEATIGEFLPEIEDYARVNAPWTDRTTDARRSLTAEVFRSSATSVVVALYYANVDYGIWLEIAHGGRYQIIMPTLDAQGPRLMAFLQSMFG